MYSVLLRKQFQETMAFLYQSSKKGTYRKLASILGFIALILYAGGCISFLFYMQADTIIKPLAALGLDWLYFALAGMVTIGTGMLVSLFTAYASLYAAKDNDLLLAMPVRQGSLLAARLTVIYILAFFGSALSFIPACVVYVNHMTKMTGTQPGAEIILALAALQLLQPLLAVFLAVVLGILIAVIAPFVRHKSLVITVCSLAFLGGYYYVFSKMNRVLALITEQSDRLADTVRKNLYLFWLIGQAAVGNGRELLQLAGMVLAAGIVLYLILAYTFIGLATKKRGAAAGVYHRRSMRVRSVQAALNQKEREKFLQSSGYMLNCGLAPVFMLVGIVGLFVKRDAMRNLLLQETGVPVEWILHAALGAICLLAGMTLITAPSISLEGSKMWILRSMPIDAGQVFRAKINLQLELSVIPAVLLTATAAWAFGATLLQGILMTAISFLYCVFSAGFGLLVNLLMPNLCFSSEMTAIKQNPSVLLVMMGNVLFLALPFLLAYKGGELLAREYLLPTYLLYTIVLNAAVYAWLHIFGRKRFEKL